MTKSTLVTFAEEILNQNLHFLCSEPVLPPDEELNPKKQIFNQNQREIFETVKTGQNYM